MNRDFTDKKAIFVWKKKFVQSVSPEKKIPAQALGKKKNSCKLKIPLPPHHFSNGPSLNAQYIWRRRGRRRIESPGGGVLPYKRLLGMCRWMGSHFHDWIDYNGVAFLVELLEWGRTFSGFPG